MNFGRTPAPMKSFYFTKFGRSVGILTALFGSWFTVFFTPCWGGSLFDAQAYLYPEQS
jgi:hypothetical protein